MKSKTYGIWIEKVIAFIGEITKDTDSSSSLVEEWADTKGVIAFQGGQGSYFRDHVNYYRQTESPISTELYNLCKAQIVAGFRCWFDKLIENFPLLNTISNEEKFRVFAENCVSNQYSPFISARTSITKAHVDLGERQNIDSIIEMYGFLNNAVQKSIESMLQGYKEQLSASLNYTFLRPPSINNTSPLQNFSAINKSA